MASLLRKGKAINGQSREIVLNVHKYFTKEAEKFKKLDGTYFKKVQDRVAEATGVSKRTVSTILKENDEKPPSMPFATPKTKRRKKTFCLDLCSADYDVIKRMVYEYHSRFDKLPKIKNLRLKLIEAINYKGSTSTLRKILLEMGFRYRKTLMEKQDVQLKTVQPAPVPFVQLPECKIYIETP